MTADSQYAFVDGHWRDVWNNVSDDQELPVMGDYWAEAVLMQPFCGCGSPDLIVEAMFAYLMTVGTMLDTGKLPPSAQGLWLMMAYVADMDALGFTEHGGSVYGAWLTDAGKRWIELVRRDFPIMESGPPTITPRVFTLVEERADRMIPLPMMPETPYES